MSMIQSILFDKRIKTKSGGKKWTVTKAKTWLKKHNLVPIKPNDESTNFISFRLADPSRFKRIRFKTFSVQKGIKARIGFETIRVSKRKSAYTRTSMSGKKVRVRPHTQRYSQNLQRNSRIGDFLRRKEKEPLKIPVIFQPDIALILYAVEFPSTPIKMRNYYIPSIPDLKSELRSIRIESTLERMRRSGLLVKHNMFVLDPRYNKFNPANMFVVRSRTSPRYIFIRFDPPITNFEINQITPRTETGPETTTPSPNFPPIPPEATLFDISAYNSIVSYETADNRILPSPSKKRNDVYFLTRRGMLSKRKAMSQIRRPSTTSISDRLYKILQFNLLGKEAEEFAKYGDVFHEPTREEYEKYGVPPAEERPRERPLF